MRESCNMSSKLHDLHFYPIKIQRSMRSYWLFGRGRQRHIERILMFFSLSWILNRWSHGSNVHPCYHDILRMSYGSATLSLGWRFIGHRHILEGLATRQRTSLLAWMGSMSMNFIHLWYGFVLCSIPYRLYWVIVRCNMNLVYNIFFAFQK